MESIRLGFQLVAHLEKDLTHELRSEDKSHRKTTSVLVGLDVGSQ